MKYTFNRIIKLWLKTKEIKRQSIINYELLIERHIKKSIGKLKINNITHQDITIFFKTLTKNQIATSTQKKLLHIIKSTLNFAYDKGYLKKYLNIRHIKFNLSKPPVYTLTKDEQTILESYLKENPNIRKISLLICLYTGLRVGEVCGLKWDNINFKKNSITINKTIVRMKIKYKKIGRKTVLTESTPKSETSYRTVPVPDFLIKLLLPLKEKDYYYILSGSEKLYDPRLLQSFYTRTLNKCNIYHNKFHTLRHTFATRAIESKMDIKTLSELLGHASIEITLKIYVHPSYELKQASIENLVHFMGN